MIDRYTRKEIKQLWSEKTKFDALLEVEILAAEAWAELGEIPTEDTKKLRERASYNIDRIKEIEAETKHDIVAFTRAVSETLGVEKKMGPLWFNKYRCC